MNRFKLILCSLQLCILSVSAQDIIITLEAQKIDAKITEVSKTEIKYKEADNLDGPTFILPTEDIHTIVYANGKVTIYNEPSETSAKTSSQAVTETSRANSPAFQNLSGTFRDWDGWLDYIHIEHPVNIQDYNTVYIYPIDASKIDYSEIDDEEILMAIEKGLASFPRIVKDELESNYPYIRTIIITDTTTFEPAEKSLILKLKINQLDMGSRALRVWIGFGSGAQSVRISGVVLNNQMEPLFDFRHKRITTNWKKYDKALIKEFQNFGEDVVHIFKTFQKRM